jgi:hypothetical protein
MLRKQVRKAISSAPIATSDAIDIAAVATVLMTSEDPAHPIDHAFDDSRADSHAWRSSFNSQRMRPTRR